MSAAGLPLRPSGFILSVDQGTTNTKAALMDSTGKPVFRASAPLQLIHPQPGFVEQDPIALWRSVRTVMEQCVAHAQALALKIQAIAISNQRETAVAWHRTNRSADGLPIPFGNSISWQCRRSAPICDRLAPHHSVISALSGLPVDPLLTAGKWTWLLEHNPQAVDAAEQQNLCLGTVDSWLLFCLTQGAAHATDLTNASRTGLLNLESRDWSGFLNMLFEIPHSALPTLQPSASHFGLCTAIPALQGVPIAAMIGDSHAAIVGHGSYAPGTVKATYGTGSSLICLTPALPAESSTLARTIAWSTPNQVQYALEGNIAMSGAAVQWVGEFLGLPSPAADTAALAETVPNSAGLYFVPAMVGLGAPHWDAAARGSITQLQRSHRAPHLARAAVESIAYQVADVLFALEQIAQTASTPISELRADGGATQNNTLMQFQADILGRPVLRSLNEDLSLLGAAAIAGLTLAWWPTLEAFATSAGQTETFTPTMTAQTRTHLQQGWQQALRRTRSEVSA